MKKPSIVSVVSCKGPQHIRPRTCFSLIKDSVFKFFGCSYCTGVPEDRFGPRALGRVFGMNGDKNITAVRFFFVLHTPAFPSRSRLRLGRPLSRRLLRRLVQIR